MKRVLALIAVLLLFTAAVPVSAEHPVTVTLILDGKEETYTVDGAFPLPEPRTGQVFAGWLLEKDGDTALYPAGAVLEPETDITLTALTVEMRTAEPELRLAGANDIGLRFLTEINAGDYAALCKVSEVHFGTIIAPKHFTIKAAGGVLTPESIAKNGKTLLVDVPAEKFYRENGEINTVAGSLHQILPQNATMEFLGVGYLSFTFADGTTGRIYAPTDLSHSAAYHKSLCAYEAAGGAKQTWVSAMLRRFAEVQWTSPKDYRIVRGEELFEMSYLRRTSDDGTFLLTVKDGVDFRFDRDLCAFLSNGVAMKPGFYTISEDGKTLSFRYSAYTENY